MDHNIIQCKRCSACGIFRITSRDQHPFFQLILIIKQLINGIKYRASLQLTQIT